MSPKPVLDTPSRPKPPGKAAGAIRNWSWKMHLGTARFLPPLSGEAGGERNIAAPQKFPWAGKEGEGERWPQRSASSPCRISRRHPPSPCSSPRNEERKIVSRHSGSLAPPIAGASRVSTVPKPRTGTLASGTARFLSPQIGQAGGDRNVAAPKAGSPGHPVAPGRQLMEGERRMITPEGGY